MKKGRTLLIVLSAALVLCIGAYIGIYVHNSNAAKKSAEETQAQLIYANGRGSPVSVSYTTDGGTFSFNLKGDKWYYSQDENFPLDQSKLTSIAGNLNSLSAIRTFDAPSSLSDFGLDKPSHVITASDNSGKTMKLLVGSQSGENYYAMLDGGNKIFTISSNLIGNLNDKLTDMISIDTIDTISESSIKTITLTRNGTSLALNKYTGNDSSYTWFVVNGSQYTEVNKLNVADQSGATASKIMSNIVSAFPSLKFSSCAAYSPTSDRLASYGFGKSELSISFTYTNKDSSGNQSDKTFLLHVGNELPDKEGFYAMLDGSNEVNVLPENALSPLIDALTTMKSAS